MFTLEEIQDEQPEVSKRDVMRELTKHHQTWEDFVLDNGDHETYNSWKVLQWLGY